MLSGQPNVYTKSLWNDVRVYLEQEVPKVTIGDITDFSTFFSAVIDERSFDKHHPILKQQSKVEILSLVEIAIKVLAGLFIQP